MKVYLPPKAAWTSALDHKLYKTAHLTVKDTRTIPPIFFRSGSIIPVAVIDSIGVRNTKHLRQLPLSLAIYPQEGQADGELYWDDGESLDSIEKKKYNLYEFKLHSQKTIEIKALHSGYPDKPLKLDQIRLHGQNESSSATHKLELENKSNVTGKVENGYVNFSGLNLDLAKLQSGHTIKLTYSSGH